MLLLFTESLILDIARFTTSIHHYYSLQLFVIDNMKTTKQIEDRILNLNNRQKDGVKLKEEVETLEWCLIATEVDIREEIVNSVSNTSVLPFNYIRLLLWALED